ncbi:MAG TPA: hypothetical protein VKU93_00390, partial [Terracidiphilus sp.]|nr:hypothetical protein [Terracidiphilus sp.]
EQVCDRVLLLSRGEIVLAGDPKTLPGDYGKPTLEDLFVSVAREPLSEISSDSIRRKEDSR